MREEDEEGGDVGGEWRGWKGRSKGTLEGRGIDNVQERGGYGSRGRGRRTEVMEEGERRRRRSRSREAVEDA